VQFLPARCLSKWRAGSFSGLCEQIIGKKKGFIQSISVRQCEYQPNKKAGVKTPALIKNSHKRHLVMKSNSIRIGTFLESFKNHVDDTIIKIAPGFAHR